MTHSSQSGPASRMNLRWVVPWIAPALAALAGILMVFRQLPLGGLDHVLWADDFDSKFIRWTVEWCYHAIFETGSPASVWNSNSYYPAPLTLTYSDAILSAQIFYGPLRLLGASPGAALYFTLVGFCLVGCLLTAIALRRTGFFTAGEQAFILFSAHFSLGVTIFFVHYQLIGMQLAPAVLLFLLLYLRDWRYADLVGLLVSFSLGFCFSTYLGPMTVTIGFLAVLPLLAKSARHEAWRSLPRLVMRRRVLSRALGSLALVVAFVVPLFYIQVLPYISARKGAAPRAYSEIAEYSARPASIVTEFSTNSAIYAAHADYAWGDWERAYFPGILLLGATATFFGLRFVRLFKPQPAPIGPEGPRTLIQRLAHHPAEPWIATMVMIFFGAYILSWGPFPPTAEWLKYPYYWLSHLIPGLRDVRAPGRFGMLLGLPMGVFSVIVIRALVDPSRGRTKHIALLAISGCILAFESIPIFKVVEYQIPHREVYRRVATLLPQNTPLLELPIAANDHITTIHRAMDQMLGSTIHWARIVSGYGARSTPEYQSAVHLDRQLNAQQGSVDSLLRFARDLGIEHVLVHTGSYAEQPRSEWIRYIRSLPPVAVQLDDGDSYLLCISPIQPSPQ